MKMRHFTLRTAAVALLITVMASPGLAAVLKRHEIPGIKAIESGGRKVINLEARDGYISTPDGNSIYCWGYSVSNVMQYPGPTLILAQGARVTINLTNRLTVPTSIIFPGQTNVLASNGVPGLITREAPPLGSVSYTFTAGSPGTYMYQSGTRPDLQTEMGLVGAIIVQPSLAKTNAYAHAKTAFDHEYLFMLTEIDPVVHELVELGLTDQVDTTSFFPVYWFINGRCAPDTMAPAFARWLPHQPYNCMPQMHPGQKILMRMIGGGRDAHPFHHHGNNSITIARDGRLLESAPGAGPDLADSDFTLKVWPGGTADAIFEWTGEKLGWDMYGHKPGDPLSPLEHAADHGKPFPVTLPSVFDVFPGELWSGSPFLGKTNALPPSFVFYNTSGDYVHMMHSHNEKEIVNNDIFPGGMMTMVIIKTR